ncbi:putative Galactoside 2-alpha-L-fucosyltransferase 1 [Hypsibius exemplaris]|uniref:L-Fucosyltransferase n=1 Tax=Hypsibius exemplaris TaxID=2072580 RepID=A0A1W0WNM0_HYPEX|nr:putative Galactoside 2-alpha-L-fucosyltransferase 1 [Hypsibius exemplaris]
MLSSCCGEVTITQSLLLLLFTSSICSCLYSYRRSVQAGVSGFVKDTATWWLDVAADEDTDVDWNNGTRAAGFPYRTNFTVETTPTTEACIFQNQRSHSPVLRNGTFSSSRLLQLKSLIKKRLALAKLYVKSIRLNDKITNLSSARLITHHFHKGRLGNWMFQAASLVGIARTNRRIPILLTTQKDKSQLFEAFHLSLIDQAALFRNATDMDRSTVPDTGAARYNSATKSLTSLPQTLVLSGYLQSWKYFEAYREEIRRLFTFRIGVYNKAEKTITDVLRTLGDEWRDAVLVGVHIRRGDVTDPDMNDVGHVPATDGYLLRSVEYFQAKYCRVVFFVVTDGVAYARALFAHHGANFAVVEGHFRQPEVDMALLTLMDHLILTVGTFGWWGGYLSDAGEVVHFRDWPRNGSVPRSLSLKTSSHPTTKRYDGEFKYLGGCPPEAKQNSTFFTATEDNNNRHRHHHRQPSAFSRSTCAASMKRVQDPEKALQPLKKYLLRLTVSCGACFLCGLFVTTRTDRGLGFNSVYSPSSLGEERESPSVSPRFEWQKVFEDFYVYSAYYVAGQSTPEVHVVILAPAVDGRFWNFVFCFCHFRNDRTSSGQERVKRAKLQRLPDEHSDDENCTVTAGRLWCALPRLQAPETHWMEMDVRCRYGRTSGAATLQVSHVRKGPEPRELSFAHCGPPIYGQYDRPAAVVEFVEYYRLMGVGRFIWYPMNVSSRTQTVLDYYVREGVMELTNWTIPEEVGARVHYFGQLAQIYDCFLKTSMQFDYTINSDLDEFFATNKTPATFASIVHNGFFDCVVIQSSFMDSNWTSYWNTDLIDPISGVPILQTSTIDQRDGFVYELPVRSKYVCKGRYVDMPRIHFVDQFRNKSAFSLAFPSPVEELILHYRPDRGNTTVKETRGMVHSSKMVHRVADIWRKLNFDDPTTKI